MNKIHLTCILFCFLNTLQLRVTAQGIGDNFNHSTLSCGWTPNASFALTENASTDLKIVSTASGYTTLEFGFNALSLASNPVVTIQVKASANFTLRADLGDVNGRYTNATPVTASIVGNNSYATYTFNFSGKFNQNSPSSATVDNTNINKVAFFFNAGSSFSGTVFFDNLQIGTGGVQDGGASACPIPPPPVNTNIRLNQIGFYPNCPKIAVVAGNPPAGNFSVMSVDLATTYFTGALSASATWPVSNEIVRTADFSSFTTPGTYVLNVPGIGNSYIFDIKSRVFHPIARGSMKAYYFHRSSTALTAACAGIYARAAGHPDNSVLIHSSAASAPRPTGTSLPAPKGWYDAGDYNSYVVNSGISTYTLMATYEHFKSYWDTLNLSIPESGDAVPDILDEIKWNLDWMLTMQDPNDGGVYHKKTTASFSGFVMPSADNATRYFCAKGTAATFDFAAVMAVAYRIYKSSNLTFANQCLAAAQSAYNWGVANPNVGFTNPGGISTGEYGDLNGLTDEWEWAASELYIATGNATYYASSFKNANTYGLPANDAWANVRTLGLISLVYNRKNLTATAFADTTNMINKILGIATPLRDHQSTTSAYKVAMGQAGATDFAWGSNSQAANQGMELLTAYELTKNISYWYAALSNLDYLLGRNATTYSFMTGFGDKTPMHPHHRPSEADGITNPVPGWLVGGPQNSNNPDGCGYPASQPATQYLDDICSYSTNEVAINWNAPLVFLSSGIEYYNPCGNTLPVALLSFTAKPEGTEVVASWITTTETDNRFFILERASDNMIYKKIAVVPGKGNSSAFTSYSYTDSKPLSGISYYRLVQTDVDGKQTITQPIAVEFSPAPSIDIFPNPSSGIFSVFISSGEETALVITGLAGQKICEATMPASENMRKIDLSFLPAGIYFLNATGNSFSERRKILIE